MDPASAATTLGTGTFRLPGLTLTLPEPSMRLWTFAKSLERPEATRSRLATVKIVAELLSGAGAESVEAVVNLLQGQLRPRPTRA